MSILLTDEELQKACGFDSIDGIDDYERDIAKAQARKIFAELRKPCPHSIERKRQMDEPNVYTVIICKKRECPLCRAEMESEVQ
jgi:hypothetical protein